MAGGTHVLGPGSNPSLPASAIDLDRRGEGSDPVCGIAVMAKASIPGRTKTRLNPPLTPEEAAGLNTAFLRDIADNLMSASAHANIAPFMAYAPAGSASFFRDILPARIGLLETVAPTFGECLYYAAASVLEAGHDAVCLLNSDSPTLPTSYLMAAATVLSAPGDRIVLGPSTDGGYYLIGLKRHHRRLFEDIDWSTERVSAQTLERARELDLAVHHLPSWYDVDDLAALRVLMGELIHDRRFRVWGSTPTPATWTRHELARLLAETDLAARLAVPAPASLVA
jgi:rSAM/selenodomain-associated transferase 1